MEYDNTAIDSHRAGNLARFKEEVSHNGPYENGTRSWRATGNTLEANISSIGSETGIASDAN